MLKSSEMTVAWKRYLSKYKIKVSFVKSTMLILLLLNTMVVSIYFISPYFLIDFTFKTKVYPDVYKDIVDSILKPIESYIQPITLIHYSIPSSQRKSKEHTSYTLKHDWFEMNNTSNQSDLEVSQEDIYRPLYPTPKLQEINRSMLNHPSYLLKHFYTGDKELSINAELLGLWNFEKLSQKEITLNVKEEGPKVLIFHTHVREKFIDEGIDYQGVSAIGQELERLLEETYQIDTLHVTYDFYLNDDSDGAYERMEPVIQNVLDEYPSIELVIDIHRDGVDGDFKFVTEINGKPTAKIMFVNGLCLSRSMEGALIPMEYLKNPYLEDNLALSLQSQIVGLEYYPNLMRKIFLKEYRYSLHMKPLSMLVEIGNQNNTLEEAVNAAQPLADIITKVLEKD